jgi:hypothetical protein
VPFRFANLPWFGYFLPCSSGGTPSFRFYEFDVRCGSIHRLDSYQTAVDSLTELIGIKRFGGDQGLGLRKDFADKQQGTGSEGDHRAEKDRSVDRIQIYCFIRNREERV